MWRGKLGLWRIERSPEIRVFRTNHMRGSEQSSRYIKETGVRKPKKHFS